MDQQTEFDSLAAVHNHLRGCQICYTRGHEIIPGAVFSGTSAARVMLIGQAPGVTEVEAKRPFNAGSGRRLFQWLGEAGWDETDFRARHYMTAVTKCYPGKHPNGKGDRVPSREEQALCRPHLEAEIQFVRPRVMLLVGKLAIGLLFPKSTPLRELIGTAVYLPEGCLNSAQQFDLACGERVSRFRGEANGRYVVPLPHPSGASLWPNKPANKALISQMITLLADLRQAWSL